MSKKPEEGKGLECIFPLYHFCVQHLARKIRFFFFIIGNSKQGKAVQGRGWREIAAYHLCHFSNDSTFRRIIHPLVFQHMLNPKFYHPLAALMSNCKSLFSRQIPSEIFSSKSLHTDMGCPNLLNRWVKIFHPQSNQYAFYKLVM